MLSQIQFKLNVEEQYLKGVEKMVQLYGMEGDRKSKADAAARRVESKQKILLLKQALKRYEELHVDMDSNDAQDGKLRKTKNEEKRNMLFLARLSHVNLYSFLVSSAYQLPYRRLHQHSQPPQAFEWPTFHSCRGHQGRGSRYYREICSRPRNFRRR
jgi:hypothetical protein